MASGVVIGDGREMIVARVGIAAVAVLASGRQRLLVVALDGPHAAGEQQRPDPLRLGAEAAEVAQAVDRLRTAPRGVREHRGKRQVVAVDAAEDGHLTERSLDRGGVWERQPVVAARRLPLGLVAAPAW